MQNFARMKKMHIIAIVIMALALAGVVAMVSDVDTYKTFNSARELPEGKSSTVVGELYNPEEIIYQPEVNPNLTTFFVKDKDGTVMKVKYFEPKPVDFERSEEVTITGEVVGDEFHATKMLVKCPSKYIEEGIAETAKAN